MQPACFAFGNHRADECVPFLGVTGDQAFGFFDQHRLELVIDAFVDDDPLHADAALARLIKGTKDNPLQRVVQIGVMIDDHGGIATQFENDLFLAGLGFQIPTDAR